MPGQMDAERFALRWAFPKSNPYNISWKNNSLDSSEKQPGGAAPKGRHLSPSSRLAPLGIRGSDRSCASWDCSGSTVVLG